MYPDARIESFINTNFIPVKIHIKEQPKTFERFGAQWTPTMQILDPDGTKRHQFSKVFCPPTTFFRSSSSGSLIPRLRGSSGKRPRAAMKIS